MGAAGETGGSPMAAFNQPAMSPAQRIAMLLSAVPAPAHQGATPLFTSEGPQFAARAYEHNAPHATQGRYQTSLGSGDEAKFRDWVKQNKVPFNPNDPKSDYDMRGYYQAMRKGQAESWGGKGAHFPDTYKTPYDTTFSGESRYAKPGTPFVWLGNSLVDMSTGQIVFKGSE